MSGVVARESVLGTVVTYVGVLVGFFTTFFILTNYLTPEEVGLTRVLVEVATLLASFALLGLTTSINRYFPYFRDSATLGQGSRAPHHGFLGYIMLVASVGSAVALPLYYLCREPIMSLFERNSALFVQYYLLAIPLALFIVFWTVSELYSIQLLKLSGTKTIRELVLRLLLLFTYIIYAVGWVDFTQFVWLFVSCYGLCMLASLWYLGRSVPLTLRIDRGFVTPTLARSVGKYTTTAVLATVGTTLAGRMDLFMLAAVDTNGLTSAAVLTVAFFMASIVETPTRAIVGIATPKIATAMKEGDRAYTQQIYQQVSFYQLISALVLFLGIWCNMDNILAIMPGGADYVQSKDVFFFLGLAKLIEVTFTGSHPIVSSSKYYHWTLYYTLWLIVVAFVANGFLIPLYGAVGASVATLLTISVGYALQQGLLSYKLGIHPLSLRLLVALPVAASMLGVDAILPQMSSPWADAVVRSFALGVVGVGVLLAFGVMSEVVSFVKSKFGKRR